MADVILKADEAEVLRHILRTLAVRQRTGEVGILHGADRFVSSQLILKKAGRSKIDAAARKLGLADGLSVYVG